MEQLLAYLQSITPFSAELAEYLAKHIKYRTLAKRDYLLKAGHVCQHICFIEQGLLRCYYPKGDTDVHTWFMKEGDLIVSIKSFYKQQPSEEYIQVLEDCSLYYITYDELQYCYKHFPEFCYIGLKLTERYYILWDEQQYGLRMRNATERFEWLMQEHPELVLRVPGKYLASYLGMNEVTLSRLKGKYFREEV